MSVISHFFSADYFRTGDTPQKETGKYWANHMQSELQKWELLDHLRLLKNLMCCKKPNIKAT